MITINWNPSSRELRWFAGMLIVFFAVIAGMWRVRSGQVTGPAILFGVTSLIGLLGLAVPGTFKLQSPKPGGSLHLLSKENFGGAFAVGYNTTIVAGSNTGAFSASTMRSSLRTAAIRGSMEPSAAARFDPKASGAAARGAARKNREALATMPTARAAARRRDR